MRCEKKANYIFKGFMTVLISYFFVPRQNESYSIGFFKLSLIYLFFIFLLRHQKETKMLRFSRCLPTLFTTSKRFLLAAAYVLPLHISNFTCQNIKGSTNPSLKSFCTHCENRASRSDYIAFDIHKICKKMFLIFLWMVDTSRHTWLMPLYNLTTLFFFMST